MVIPARPTEPYLREAVESVLDQPEVVMLVVATHEQHSPTTRLVASFPDPRVRVVISQGPSAGANLDAGVARTDAPWLAFLDADDRWPANRLDIGLRAAVARGAHLVLGGQQAMGADGCLLDVTARAPLLGAALVTREASQRIGPFGEDLVAQMRWLVRAREIGIAIVEVEDVMLQRRVHDGNLSRIQRTELHRAYLALARERAAAQSRSGGQT